MREGAIIPTIELEQYVNERREKSLPNPITFNIYPGPYGQYDLYLDDGVSRSSAPVKDRDQGGDPQAKGEYRHVHFESKYREGRRQITIERVHDNFQPIEDFLYLAIIHDPSERKAPHGSLRSVSLRDRQLDLTSAGSLDADRQQLAQSPSSAWRYDYELNISFIKIFDTAARTIVQLDYA